MALLFASVIFLLSLCTSRAPTRQAVPPRKYGRTFVLIPKYFAIKIQVNSIFISKSLCMSNFCCNFAAQTHAKGVCMTLRSEGADIFNGVC